MLLQVIYALNYQITVNEGVCNIMFINVLGRFVFKTMYMSSYTIAAVPENKSISLLYLLHFIKFVSALLLVFLSRYLQSPKSVFPRLLLLIIIQISTVSWLKEF